MDSIRYAERCVGSTPTRLRQSPVESVDLTPQIIQLRPIPALVLAPSWPQLLGRTPNRECPMKLNREQSEKLLHEGGISTTDACDSCGKLLGSVRYTCRGEPGEWCSALCRDGIEAVVRCEARTAGRPRKHATNAERQRAYRARRPRALRNPIAAD